jgi:hypothetical protein
MRMARGALVFGVVAGSMLVAAAPAAADPPMPLVITAGCHEVDDPETTFSVDVVPHGAVAFVVDAAGERTGEMLHLLSLDLAAFTTPGGELVFEQDKTWGTRAGQTDVIFCSGFFVPEPGIIAFFDVLATRR